MSSVLRWMMLFDANEASEKLRLVILLLLSMNSILVLFSFLSFVYVAMSYRLKDWVMLCTILCILIGAVVKEYYFVNLFIES
jgi:hypothetical protein